MSDSSVIQELSRGTPGHETAQDPGWLERSCPQETLRCNRCWGQTLKLHASFCYVRHDPTPPENTLTCVITIYLAQGSGISSQRGLLVHCSQLTLSEHMHCLQLVIYCTGLSSKPSFLLLQESDWAPW